MKTKNSDPDEARLRDLLREARPAPPLPPRFAEAVWRRIEKGEAPSASPPVLAWFDRVVERLLAPRFAVASVIVLLLLSGVAGVLSGTATAKRAAQARYLSAVAPFASR